MRCPAGITAFRRCPSRSVAARATSSSGSRNEYERLLRFETIYLALDMDPEGEAAAAARAREADRAKLAISEIDAEEGPWVSAKQFPDGNTGHRPPIKGG